LHLIQSASDLGQVSSSVGPQAYRNND